MVQNGSAHASRSSQGGKNCSGSSIPPSRKTSFWYRNQVALASDSQNAAPAKACWAARFAASASAQDGSASSAPAPALGAPATVQVNAVPMASAMASRTAASPSSLASRNPSTETGRSSSVATAPVPMSTPTSSMSRGLVAITAPSATVTYHSSAAAE